MFAGTFVRKLQAIGGGVNVNTRKTLVASISIVCLTVLTMADRIDSSYGATGIVGITMYIIGNGVAAATGKEVDPLIKRKRTPNERADDE